MRVLCIAGGGMKGLPAAAALDELQIMAAGKLADHVDLIAGTSIGGILAGLVSAALPGPYTSFFTQDGPAIFNPAWYRHWPLYPAGPIEAVLQRRFDCKALKDCKTKLLVPALNRTDQVPFMFKSYDTGNLLLDGATPLWQVGRATSAAQRYFPAFKLGNKYLWDGGNIANDPSVCAYADACKLWPGEQVKLLTIGCGQDDVPAPGWPQWVQDLALTIGLQFATGQEEVQYQMKQFLGDYYRVIQPTFAAPVKLDGADPSSLAYLVEAGRQFVNDQRPMLEWFLS